MSWPDVISHSRMLLSPEAEARVRPSGDKATLSTEPVCPVRVFLSWPDVISHSRMLLSHEADSTEMFNEAEARVRPSGEKSTLLTTPVCPVRVVLRCPDVISHTRTLPSEKAEARERPSGEKDKSTLDSPCAETGDHQISWLIVAAPTIRPFACPLDAPVCVSNRLSALKTRASRKRLS